MERYPKPLEELIYLLRQLPGIGKKSATRFALFLVREENGITERLAKALLELKRRIRLCPICLNVTEDIPCHVCSDPSRERGIVCVVETPEDEMAIEDAGIFKGRYHILHGVLSPIDNMGPEDLHIGKLLERIEKENIKELILATNPTPEGEATANYIAELLKGKGIKITRIASGIPMGGDIKYMDPVTLKQSFENRKSAIP